MSDVRINVGGDELLACPFCQGGKFSIYRQRRLYAVQCLNCGAVGPTGHSRQEAETLWNEQPQLAAAIQRADAAESKRTHLEIKLNAVHDRVGESLRRAHRAEEDFDRLREDNVDLKVVLAATVQRAEAAEAKLAAVPVAALMRVLFTGYRTDEQITADADAINAWVARQQSEVQP